MLVLVFNFVIQCAASDVDECSLNDHDCNVSTSYCVNTNGGYRCDCLVGFNQTDDGQCECKQ